MTREQRGGVRRRGMMTDDKSFSRCSLQTPLFSQSGKLDLLKKPQKKPQNTLKVAKKKKKKRFKFWWRRGYLCGNLKHQK